MHEKMFDRRVETSTHDTLMVDRNKDETSEYNDAPQFSLATYLLRTISGSCGAFSIFYGVMISFFSIMASNSGNESVYIMERSFFIILGFNVSYCGCHLLNSAFTGAIGSWWDIWDIIKEHMIYYIVCVAVWVPLVLFAKLLFTSVFRDISILCIAIVSPGLAVYVYTSILKRVFLSQDI